MQRCPDTQNNIREVKEQKLNEAQTDLEKPHQENGFRNVLYVGGGNIQNHITLRKQESTLPNKPPQVSWTA